MTRDLPRLRLAASPRAARSDRHRARGCAGRHRRVAARRRGARRLCAAHGAREGTRDRRRACEVARPAGARRRHLRGRHRRRVLGKPADAAESRRCSSSCRAQHEVLSAVTLRVGLRAHSRDCRAPRSASVDRRRRNRGLLAQRRAARQGRRLCDPGPRRRPSSSHLAGSYSGVVGLPLFETAQLLEAAGSRLDAPRIRAVIVPVSVAVPSRAVVIDAAAGTHDAPRS
jgi:hypothetical protein